MQGVDRIVMLAADAGSTAGFALVGKTTWHARQAALAVDVDWQQRPAGGLDTRGIEARLETAVRSMQGHVFHERGDVDAAEAKGRQVRPGIAGCTLPTPPWNR